MKSIAILNTDTIPAELARVHGQYPDMFIRCLSALNNDIEFVRFDVNRDEYPSDWQTFSGVLITGSQSAAYDQDPWINRLQACIRELYRQQIPLVGICFGHQVIHQALGGQVQKAAQGWCVGIHQNRLTCDIEGLGNQGQLLSLLSSHQDQVVAMAPGSKLLASTPYCPIAATYWNETVLTFQGHPEFTRDYAQALMDKRRTDIGESTYRAAVESMSQPLDDVPVLRRMLHVLTQGSRVFL
ncbi:glutamine amidotransferase-related protein [Gilvimarinus xylanilyticus]|uniref:Gamma-glutamyl-gamma-aminobutyrate hydrolase family protein n=1 Tax=Gilvimarinus xylanilyticus TaxID=2944139 RepID=A0A9X2I5Z4_9GAMM|nr:gamma-glutamyl-gamma-aminobutyrate hydrolase family protein [Gilvimarinus xylanilyticus]MCP8899507.1 gamma-glutamyl-gamma-aminobutyrate hydrolase family protein [Gilvimarinus xylanilyticus]